MLNVSQLLSFSHTQNLEMLSHLKIPKLSDTDTFFGGLTNHPIIYVLHTEGQTPRG